MSIPQVAIVGRPNVGKSSLFNCLLGEERAIVTRHPGTTRDAIEAELAVDGIVLRLVDTAGLREARDEVEAAGVELARRQLEGAQVVLVVLEGTRDMFEEEVRLIEEISGCPHLVAVSKCDLLDEHGNSGTVHNLSGLTSLADTLKLNGHNVIRTSAVTGEGRNELIATLLRVGAKDVRFSPEAPAITRLRHKVLLERCLEPLDAALGQAASGYQEPEKVAADLRDAARLLEEILGAVTPDDLLDDIFSAYCIGK